MSITNLSAAALRSRRLPRWSELQALFQEWRVRSRTRYELGSLSDRELWGMRLNGIEAGNEASKPFWEA
jgi:uncharacterized protein YjiS (DUF1127 family)